MTGERHSDVGPEIPAVENHTQRVQLRRTCGAGRPPAAGGQSGNMTFRWGVLHWQAGEGLDMLQFPFRKTSVTDWSTGGVNQLDSVGEHGNVLTEKSTGNGEWILHVVKRVGTAWGTLLRLVSIKQKKNTDLTTVAGPRDHVLKSFNKGMARSKWKIRGHSWHLWCWDIST